MRSFTQPLCRFGIDLLVLGCATASAQDNAAQIDTQQDVARRTFEEPVQPDTEVSAADPELGEINLVSRTPRPKMFTFFTTQSFHFTNNAFLLPEDGQNALFWNGRFGASVVPYATRNFTPRVTFEQNFFRYEDVSQLDFDSHSLQLDLKFDLTPDDSWFVNVSYAGARLYTPRGDAGEFFRYGLPSVSISHFRQLWSSPVYFAGTAGTTYRHGDPSEFDRVTAFVNASFLYSPLEHFQLTAFIRPEGQFYTNDPIDDSRRDLNVSLGVTASLTPVEYVSIGFTTSFVGNYSSSDPSDYEVFSPSIVFGGRIAF